MIIIWSNHAESMRDSIIRYIAQDNIEAAFEFDLLITEACEKLTHFPKIGRKGRISSTYELVIHSHYILVYLIKDMAIEIVTLVHTSRNFP